MDRENREDLEEALDAEAAVRIETRKAFIKEQSGPQQAKDNYTEERRIQFSRIALKEASVKRRSMRNRIRISEMGKRLNASIRCKA